MCIGKNVMPDQTQIMFQIPEEKQNTSFHGYNWKGQRDSLHAIAMSYFDAMDVLLNEM